MAKEIWKWSTPVADVIDEVWHNMPAEAQLLSVANQDESLCIWALVDPTNRPVRRRIKVFGTGHPIEGDQGQFVGTALFMKGRLVLHVFGGSK